MKKIIVLADRSQTSPSCRSCCALASRVAQPPTATQTRESTTAMHKRNWRERNVGGIGDAERGGKRCLAQARFQPPQAQPRSNVAINGARKRRSAGPVCGRRALCNGMPYSPAPSTPSIAHIRAPGER